MNRLSEDGYNYDISLMNLATKSSVGQRVSAVEQTSCVVGSVGFEV